MRDFTAIDSTGDDIKVIPLFLVQRYPDQRESVAAEAEPIMEYCSEDHGTRLIEKKLNSTLKQIHILAV